jgi:hypothetical protein
VQWLNIDPADGLTVIVVYVSAWNVVSAVNDASIAVSAVFRFADVPEPWSELVVSVEAEQITYRERRKRGAPTGI